MRALAYIIAASLLLAGCASLEEAYYVDREIGQAQMATWDKQVAFPDYRHVAKLPEVTEGIDAEEIMNIYNETYSEEPTEERINIMGFGEIGE